MRYLRLLVCLLGLLSAVASLHAQREKFPPEDLTIVEKRWPTAKKTSTGLRYVIQEEGTGAPAAPATISTRHFPHRPRPRHGNTIGIGESESASAKEAPAETKRLRFSGSRISG